MKPRRGGGGGEYIWCEGYKIVECSAKFFQEDRMCTFNWLLCIFLIFFVVIFLLFDSFLLYTLLLYFEL